MKRRDEGKTRLVEFLRSIRFAHPRAAGVSGECTTHFAHFHPHARTGAPRSAEENQLIRSAN